MKQSSPHHQHHMLLDIGIDGASGLYPTLSPTSRRDTLEETGRNQSPRYRLRDPRSTRDPCSGDGTCNEPNAGTCDNHSHDDIFFWYHDGASSFHIHFLEHNNGYDVYVVHRHNYEYCANCHDLPRDHDYFHDLLECSVNSHLEINTRDEDCPVHIYNLDDGNRDHNWSNDSDYG